MRQLSSSDLFAMLSATRHAQRPFDPCEELTRLREQEPLSRLTCSDGSVCWVVSSYALVRAVLADPRFSARYDLLRYPLPDGVPVELPRASVGDLTGIDPPEHTRYRRALTGRFTTRRMRQLADRIKEIAVAHLDAMQRHGPPVDLVQAYAWPIPALTICELLGVGYADREYFKHLVERIGFKGSTLDERITAYAAVEEFLHGLVRDKRANATDDLLSDLLAGDLTDAEVTGIGTFLLGAGLDTTANMLSLGAFALLRRPDQLAALRADPGLADQSVEELLRYLTITDVGARAAKEDVELDGRVIRAGETVLFSLQAANRDPEQFTDPDTLDLSRSARGHVAFGHGIHQCLGQQLARVEMRVGYSALFDRFPTLRLAVPPEDVLLRTDMTIYGVHELPVTWADAVAASGD